MYTTGIYAAPLSLLILAMLKDHNLPFYEFQLMLLFYINIIFNIFSVIGLVSCFRKKRMHSLFCMLYFSICGFCAMNLKYARINSVALPVSYLALLLSSIMTVYTHLYDCISTVKCKNQTMNNITQSKFSLIFSGNCWILWLC